jgi:predicted adenylyl cyclase CyaB
VELKARYDDLGRARQILAGLDATGGSVEEQTDSYFRVPAGRLKLRQIRGRESELIFYDRDESGVHRECSYEIYRHPPSPQLMEILAAALGELVRVAKRREVHWIGEVKVNLDEVEGLGCFIEFEVPVTESTKAAEGRIQELKERFAIGDDDIVGCSYSDLIESARPSTRTG